MLEPINQVFIKETVFMETSRLQISCSLKKKDFFLPSPAFFFF